MPNIKRLVCAGDSLTDQTLEFSNRSTIQPYGECPTIQPVFASRDHIWSDDLARELKCETINAGVGGDTARNFVKHMNDYIYKYNPSHVLLNIGNNDLAPWCRYPYDEVIKNIRYAVGDLVNNGIVVYMWHSTCNVYPPILGINDKEVPQFERTFENYKAEMRRIANSFKDEGCQFINVWNFGWGKVPLDYKCPDQIHNSVKGNFLIAQALYNAIKTFSK